MEEENVLKGAQVFVARYDPEPSDWKPLGTLVSLSMVETPEEDDRWEEMKQVARQLTNKTVTTTFHLSKKPTLGYREMLRLFGFQPSSLIHNGKKRRKR